MNQKQQQSKRLLTKNFFMEAMKRELELEYKRQLSDRIKQALARKKLSTFKRLECKQ